MKYCLLQVSDRLLNPDNKSNPADNYFKAIWPNMAGEGYYRPEQYWEIPTWIAELSHCLKDKDHELILYHIDKICTNDCPTSSQHDPLLPDADIYFASVMDCNKDILRTVIQNNPDKQFYLGGYIGQVEFVRYFYGSMVENNNVSWYKDIPAVCKELELDYRYGTDYRLFKGMKCIPRLTLSKGCTNHCRFCTVPDKVIETDPLDIFLQLDSMRDLDFELIYINDKTFGQCHNYKHLGNMYTFVEEFNPKFRGFTVQTTCRQVSNWALDNISLQDLHIVNVEIGVESYNQSILEKYRKPQSIRTIDNALHLLVGMGMNIIPNIIVGLPGEDIYTYSETLKWVDDNKHDFLMLNVTNFVPYVGSDASDIVKTQPEDLNQTVCQRSYHTTLEAEAVELFTEVLFRYGMEIIKKTKEGNDG